MPRADGEQPLLTENGSQIQGGGSEPFPVGRMFAILCFGFSFGELISNFGLIMLPAESGYMEPANNAIMMTFLLFISGVSQFSGPLAGYYSDRCQLNWGRRRPYLFVGTLFTIPSVIMLWVSHNMYFVKGEGDGQTGSFAAVNTTDHSSLFGFKVGEHFWGEVIYITFFLVAMAAFNVQMQTLGSLISDLVPQDQTGQANGVLAVLMLTGSLMGFLVFRLLSGGFGTSLEPDGSPGFWHWLPITIPVEDTVGKMYFYYTPVIFITTCVTLLGAKEQKNPTPEHLLPPVTCKDICECFFVSPTHHRDFFIVTASRTMYACRGPAPPTVMDRDGLVLTVSAAGCRYYCGISTMAFLQYFFRDLVRRAHAAAPFFITEGSYPTSTLDGRWCAALRTTRRACRTSTAKGVSWTTWPRRR